MCNKNMIQKYISCKKYKYNLYFDTIKIILGKESMKDTIRERTLKNFIAVHIII